MKISQMVFILQSRHEYMVEMVMFNVQRAIIPKVGKPELWFMCSARHLMVLYIQCVKFPEIAPNDIRVIEQTQVHGRNGHVQCSKGNYSVSNQTRNTGHVFCTSSHGALHWCEVS